jgi:predicted acetyltransferase
MAFELKASLLINHKEHNVSYIYACGTLKKFRGKSLMKQILEKIYIEACQADKAAVILLPASDSLYSYYENLGFQKFFYQNKSRIESSKKHLSKQKNIYHISKTNATIYSSLRKQHLLADYTIHYPNSHFQVLDELFAHEPQQGFFLISKEKKVIGFCFIEKTEETLYLKELYLFEPFSDTLYQLFFEQFQVRQIELTMPLSFENDQNQPSALIRWNPRFLPQKKSRGYFNFGLE